MHKLRLYVSGRTPKTLKLIERLKALLEDELPGEYALEIIDVLENSQKAVDEKVLATPTLIRLSPEPVRRVIGDLSAREGMLAALDLTARKQ